MTPRSSKAMAVIHRLSRLDRYLLMVLPPTRTSSSSSSLSNTVPRALVTDCFAQVGEKRSPHWHQIVFA
jgi:hypothetical protein